jgi:hypothetical protein
MTKKIEYTATFSDGTVLTRKSHREYQAAWRWTGTRIEDGRVLSQDGFSATRELAAKALRAHTNWCGLKVDFAEVTSVSRPGPALLDDVLSGKGGAA